jgi:hypothetical protein
VLFDPNAPPEGDERPTVVRGLLRLSAEGPRKTLATEAPQAATLTFKLGLITQLRETLERTEQAWVTLNGKLELLTADAEPRFELDDPALSLDDSTLDDESELRQFFFFDFDPTSFGKVASLKVPLPALEPEVRHLEVSVELKIAGAVESAADANDVLDRPICRQVLDVTPSECLDTPVGDPSEHNLAFLASIHDDPFEVEELRLNGEALTEGEQFFQSGGRVFFRPAAKPSGPLQGRLLTTDGRLFDFELKPAETLRQRMNSLDKQIRNGVAMAAAAASEVLAEGDGSDAAQALEERLLSDVQERKIRLLDSIESTLSTQQEFAAFYGRVPTLSPVFPTDDEESALA